MRINDRRLARMIARDPVPVAYTIKETDISVTGLLHRPLKGRAKDESETEAGKVENDNLFVMVIASAMTHVPVEGTMIAVNGNNYRAGMVELSPDLTHYIIELRDPAE